ncbi:587_t:CDS:2 [Funneliformis caledonium]|uniref:587_t:CDS:1 n=1 Tax=Funneliformis caledonium TaxID=1117310 RepID=A0A9N8Z0M6_9GLOM|nr:587_t:CDS:2 [Funneliformis caledonium]
MRKEENDEYLCRLLKKSRIYSEFKALNADDRLPFCDPATFDISLPEYAGFSTQLNNFKEELHRFLDRK